MPWDTGGTEPGLMTSSTPGGPPSSYHGQDKQKQTERDSGHILKQTKEKKIIPTPIQNKTPDLIMYVAILYAL